MLVPSENIPEGFLSWTSAEALGVPGDGLVGANPPRTYHGIKAVGLFQTNKNRRGSTY
jgi:hypothetical protein